MPISLSGRWIPFHYRTQLQMVFQTEKKCDRRHLITFHFDRSVHREASSKPDQAYAFIRLFSCSAQNNQSICSLSHGAQSSDLTTIISSQSVFAAFGKTSDEVFDIVIHELPSRFFSPSFQRMDTLRHVEKNSHHLLSACYSY